MNHRWIMFLLALPLSAAERFDYHSIRKQAAAKAGGVFEGELHLRTEGKARAQGMRGFGTGWRGDAHLLWDGKVGEANAVEFDVDKAGKYALAMQWTLAPDYGLFEVQLNGKVIEPKLDLYSPRVEPGKPRKLGEVQLKSGVQRMVSSSSGQTRRRRSFRGKATCTGWIICSSPI